jgi:hypothetical protein
VDVVRIKYMLNNSNYAQKTLHVLISIFLDSRESEFTDMVVLEANQRILLDIESNMHTSVKLVWVRLHEVGFGFVRLGWLILG